jgi:hypothetical protein
MTCTLQQKVLCCGVSQRTLSKASKRYSAGICRDSAMFCCFGWEALQCKHYLQRTSRHSSSIMRAMALAFSGDT